MNFIFVVNLFLQHFHSMWVTYQPYLCFWLLLLKAPPPQYFPTFLLCDVFLILLFPSSWSSSNYAGFEVFTAMAVDSTVFWVVASCRHGESGIAQKYSFHPQGESISKAQLATCSCECLACLTLWTWKWRSYSSPKCRTVSKLCGVTTQRTVLFDFRLLLFSKPMWFQLYSFLRHVHIILFCYLFIYIPKYICL